MRLGRLDLLRYGHFTDRSIELPVNGLDFHIVFGPNEAGKSTVLAAVGDLLFGIPMHSPYNFRHDYSSMRIGAILQNGAAAIRIVRRKGNKDTLLGTDDVPIPGGESALRPYLTGADRAFFERMFSLDHLRLAQGGREILEAKDEVGQMLFSVGAGIGGLRDRLSALNTEADSLWGKKRAGRRLYTKAGDKLKEAQLQLREETFTAKRWHDLKRTHQAAEEAHGEVEAEFERMSVEAQRLARVRRIYRDVFRKHELETRIETLGKVVSLPEDAARLLSDAERREADASTRIETLSAELKQAGGALENSTYDQELVLRADDIGQLHERRIEIRGEKADLPKRQAELEAAEGELRALARELGWKDEKGIGVLIARIAPRAEVGVVRSLLGRRGELTSNETSRTEALEEAEAELRVLAERRSAMEETTDVSRLSRASRTVRDRGDLAGRLRAAGQQVADARERGDRLLASLHPGIASEVAAVEMAVPAFAAIENHRDLVVDSERRARELRQRIETDELELERARSKYERTAREEFAPTSEALEEVRRRRDGIWELVKLSHIEGVAIPDELAAAHDADLDDLAGAFEDAAQAADETADRRFDRAEAAGRLAEMSRAIAEQGERLDQSTRQVEKLAREGESLEITWREFWKQTPVEPSEPESMLEWLRIRGELLETIGHRAEASSALEILRLEERDARALLVAELTALQVDPATSRNLELAMLLEHATDVERDHVAQAERAARLKEASSEARSDVERRRRELERAEKASSTWREKWSVALEGLGLAADLAPEAVEAQLDVIDRMRDSTSRINNLRHDRIGKINRDAEDFERVVADLVGDVAKDLGGGHADDAVLELERRLGDAQRVRDLVVAKKAEIERLEEQVAALEETRREARESVGHLEHAAAATTIEELREAIEKSDSLRRLQDEMSETSRTLEAEGDGRSVDALVEECAGIDVDSIAAREETIADTLKSLRERLTAATDARSVAREAFQAVGGGDAAARAAAMRQEAFAELGEVARRYARVRSSAILLQWAIDRYMDEKKGPLLKRAGELFATITGGSFMELRVDYDDRDRVQLIGRRPDGTFVPVLGMSTGTEHQLYLALRVASIEDYLERADALPFIADDLFIDFDEDRSAAGFEVLAHLAQRTQVLFFTHDRHLVEIARDKLGSSLHVTILSDG